MSKTILACHKSTFHCSLWQSKMFRHAYHFDRQTHAIPAKSIFIRKTFLHTKNGKYRKLIPVKMQFVRQFSRPCCTNCNKTGSFRLNCSILLLALIQLMNFIDKLSLLFSFQKTCVYISFLLTFPSCVTNLNICRRRNAVESMVAKVLLDN